MLRFEKPARPGKSDEQCFDPMAEVCIVSTDTAQVIVASDRVCHFKCFAKDRHQLGVSVGHRITSGSGFSLPCPVRTRSAPGNSIIIILSYPSVKALASQARAKLQCRSAVRRGKPRALPASPSVIPAKNRNFTISAATG